MNKDGLPRQFARLDGLTAVVTGSSSGIGQAIALAIAEAGADVLVHAAKNRSGANETASQIQSLERDSTVKMCNFCDGPDAIEEFAEQAWRWKGGVDILINNAGADVLTGDGSNSRFREKLQLLLDVDVKSTIQLSRAIGKQMKKGAILNIGWDQASTGMEGESGELFATTKAAVMAFTKSLSRSLAPQVRVNCIAAGWIKTAWGDQASSSWQSRAKSESSLGRWGTPEDIASTARFLVSEEASFITGQVIQVNGGFRGSA